ncbi:MAG: nucleoside kinase [Lachnospiraceae bacterium]|nr:nucleoside kinase [Lachnospiraceae bacterium]
MSEKKYQVTIDGTSCEYPEGTPYGEILEAYDRKFQRVSVLVLVNGRLRELHKKLKENCVLEPVDITTDIGHKTYKRSMSLLLLKAIYHISGQENVDKVVLHYSVSSGYYYTIKGRVALNESYLEELKSYMMSLVKQNLPIMKRSVSTAEARELFASHRMYDKEKLFRYRRVSKVNIYSLEDFEDYFYGFMCWHTGFLKYFDLKLYDEGLVLQMPEKDQPTVIPAFAPSPKIFKVQQESERWGEKLQVDMVGALNECIGTGNIKNLILISEALQEANISKIAEKIAGKPKVKFVMIAGPSSSGKTTFSHRLSVQLSVHGLQPHPIGMDNFYRNRVETPRDANGNYDFECLEALDIELFNEKMTALLNGQRVELPYYNFKTGKREYKGEMLQIGENDILVIEGIHGLNDKLSYMLPAESKFKVYISALTQLNIDEHNRIPTTDGRLIRRIVRDNRTRGTSAQETIAMWASVRRGEDNNIFPFQEEADVMFNSALIYELAVLKLYAEPILFQIAEDTPEYQEAKRLLKFLDYFVGVPSEGILCNSILREFIGGSCFDV